MKKIRGEFGTNEDKLRRVLNKTRAFEISFELKKNYWGVFGTKEKIEVSFKLN